MSYPEEYLYTEDHEWMRVEDGKGYVGITSFAQEQLGDVVFVELPEPDEEFAVEEAFGVVESVKTVADLYMPVGGKVVEINERLFDEPELVNEDPHDKGWMVAIEIADKGELEGLMDADEYTDIAEE
jgi:glycine cleavage system H protein